MAELSDEGLLQPVPEHGPDAKVFGLGYESCYNFFVLALMFISMAHLLHLHLPLPMHPSHGDAERALEEQDHEVHGLVGVGEGAKIATSAKH